MYHPSRKGRCLLGFYAKAVVLLEGRVKADQVGKNGETESVVWSDSRLDINFDRVTRLEKLTADRFKHLTWSPFQRGAFANRLKSRRARAPR